ncbi:glycosyltransferase family 2 protein [Pelomyxa schiedti]|nr:glycosyltransferase family 2 protein [Pelomyxa schiedti]
MRQDDTLELRSLPVSTGETQDPALESLNPSIAVTCDTRQRRHHRRSAKICQYNADSNGGHAVTNYNQAPSANSEDISLETNELSVPPAFEGSDNSSIGPAQKTTLAASFNDSTITPDTDTYLTPQHEPTWDKNINTSSSTQANMFDPHQVETSTSSSDNDLLWQDPVGALSDDECELVDGEEGEEEESALNLLASPNISKVDPAEAKYLAYREKMKLLGIFLCLNVMFILVIQCAPSIAVQMIFLFYIVASAFPKFLFGSILLGCRPHLRNLNRLNSHDIEASHEGKIWSISAPEPFCSHCSTSCIGLLKCSKCGLDVTLEHPILVTACITVYHEDSSGLAAGVRSFQLAQLNFAPRYCKLVFIIDGRYDRSGKFDALQKDTTTFLLSKLYNIPISYLYSDDDAVVRYKEPNGSTKKSRNIPQPEVFADGVAMYKGLLPKKGMPFVVLLKRLNQGKRHSHQLFFEYMDQGILEKTAHGIMFVDSDVTFSWKGNTRSMLRMYKGLIRRKEIGGTCGEIEVLHWYQNPLTITQYFEYKTNQFLAKTCESWFGMVTCLPGAFCMVKPQAVETILNAYLAATSTIWAKNQLDLGEDRTMTTQLLQTGWETTYEPRAVARTEVPSTLIGLIKQRRRWINSTIVNMVMLLKTVWRPVSFPLFVSLSIELFSSFALPTAILMLVYEIAVSVGMYPPVALALIVLWCLLLLTLSLTSRIEQLEYWFHASTLFGAVITILMVIFAAQNLEGLFTKYWIEVVVMVAWVLFIAAAAVIHHQWFSVLGIVAPLTWLILSPTMYVVIPIYAVCNFDDVTWGTRGG